GKEAIPAGRRILSTTQDVLGTFRLYYEEFAWGTDYYMEHGMMMPRDALNHNSLKTTVPLLQISNQQSP
ncbi:MAG: hypothetical protein ACXW4U_12045, partial [Anaerolineales bacterium]